MHVPAYLGERVVHIGICPLHPFAHLGLARIHGLPQLLQGLLHLADILTGHQLLDAVGVAVDKLLGIGHGQLDGAYLRDTRPTHNALPELVPDFRGLRGVDDAELARVGYAGTGQHRGPSVLVGA